MEMRLGLLTRRKGGFLISGVSLVDAYIILLFFSPFLFSFCHQWFRFNRCLSMVEAKIGDFAEYFPALLAECLVKLTSDVNYAVIPGRQYNLLWTFRRLPQILSDLICKHRPARKPPWKQYVDEDLDGSKTRIRRSQNPYKQTTVLSIIKKNYISLCRRVPINLKVSRCNGWIAAFDFRMQNRILIYDKMTPKQENHTRLTDKMKTIKISLDCGARFCFFCFYYKFLDCSCNLNANIVISGSY